MTTAAAGLMVRPKWAPRAETVPSRTGSSPIEPAAGTKNSMTATAGAIPVPETTARPQGATIPAAMARSGQGAMLRITISISPLSRMPSANVEAATISEMTW